MKKANKCYLILSFDSSSRASFELRWFPHQRVVCPDCGSLRGILGQDATEISHPRGT